MDILDRFTLKVDNLKKLKSKELRISATEAEELAREIKALKTEISNAESEISRLKQVKKRSFNTTVNIDGDKF